MNTFKISGKVIDKKLYKKDDRHLDIIIGIPLSMKVLNPDGLKDVYSYVAFTLYGLDQDQYSLLRKGNYVEINGFIIGNCNENGTKKRDLVVVPKSIVKGVYK